MAKKKKSKPTEQGIESIAQSVRNLVNLKPQAREGLSDGTLNQSAVARAFLKELGLGKKNFHAVLSAVKRVAEGLETPPFEADAKKVIAKSTISLRSDVAAVRVFPSAPISLLKKQIEVLHLVQGTNSYSLIVHSVDLGGFLEKNREHVFGAARDLTQITIISPPEIETTPGVLLSFLNPFYSNGINVEEVLSASTDTILLVSSKDAQRAFALLQQIIRDARK